MTDEAIWNKYREELVRYASMLVGPSGAEDLLSTVVVRALARQRLADLHDAHQPAGHLILESAYGVTWTSSFERR